MGSSNWFVVEADESDTTFLYLRPHIAIITNIDHDHLENYDNDLEKLKKSFVQFIRNLGINDYAVVCNEDKNTQSLLHLMHRNLVTYGFSNHCSIYATDVIHNQTNTQFKVISKKFDLNDDFQISLPGSHNVLNTLAAISSAKLAGIATEKIQSALVNFEGVKRRFESLGLINFSDSKKELVELIDDYAHHPDEIIHTLKSAQNRFKDKRVVALFQAHRYTRTKALFDRFANALILADELILLPIYSAGEINHQNIHNQDLIELMKKIKPSFKVSQIYDDEFNTLNLEDKTKFLKVFLAGKIQKSDVIISMGAGSIRSIVEGLV